MLNWCQSWINSGLIMVNIGDLIWSVVWNHGILWLSIYWECHHPNWRTPSFFRGVGQPPTSNGLIMSAIDTVQLRMNDMLGWDMISYSPSGERFPVINNNGSSKARLQISHHSFQLEAHLGSVSHMISRTYGGTVPLSMPISAMFFLPTKYATCFFGNLGDVTIH